MTDIATQLRNWGTDPYSYYGTIQKCNTAAAELERKDAEIERLREALEELVDWDGQTWRIDSRHPNDQEAEGEWKTAIKKARAALASMPILEES